MTKRLNIIGCICVLIAAVILILDASTAAIGVREGVDLCINAVIPALFPFLFLSGMLNRIVTGHPISILRPIGRLCRIPSGAEGIFLTGLISGYPVGATMVANAFQNGSLSETDARRMLGFCNQAGPAFLFGMLGPVIKNNALLWVIWGLQIFSAVFTAILLPRTATTICTHKELPPITVTDSMKRAIHTMAMICGWVILFRVLLVFAKQWFLGCLSPEIQILLTGCLELSNGCTSLSTLESGGLAMVFSGLFLSFGGVCVGMQTASVCGSLGTGMYFPGKLLQCSINCVLSTIASALIFPRDIEPTQLYLIILTIFTMISTLIYLHRKKVVAFLRRILYNNGSYYYERG